MCVVLNLHDDIEPVIEVVTVGAVWCWERSHCELGGQLLSDGLVQTS